MKTIGKLLKDTRVKKRYSVARLEKITKIRTDYIRAIEAENWDSLPEKPVVAGFINSIAQSLGVDKKQTSALFRRDYPPRTLRVNPKPDLLNKFVWSPRLTFIVGIFLVVLTIIGYLAFQYINFISPPSLEVSTPFENQVITENKLKVTGTTDSDASVVVNNQPVIVGEGGNFMTEIEIFGGTGEIIISAKSRSGKETVIHRKIIPKLGEP
jgi:cytoskeletal protein RodZ